MSTMNIVEQGWIESRGLADPCDLHSPSSRKRPERVCQAAVDLLENLIRQRKELRWNLDSKHLGCSDVDDEFELGRHPNWQITWFVTLQDASRVEPSLTNGIIETVAVANQPAGIR